MDLIYLVKKEMLRRKYSHKTIISYIYCLKKFLKNCHKEPRKITKKDIRDYLQYLSDKRKSGSTLNVNLQAIKFALEHILNKRFFVRFPYSKTPKKLPEVLTKEEVYNLLQTIKNQKHKLMIQLMYSAGLRVSELVKLKPENFQFSHNYGWIRQGKGNKDRMFIIAEKLKDKLLNHIKEEKIKENTWLFKGRDGKHLSTRTIYQIVKNAAKKAKIKKNIHPHTLRHSFATHLIEDGYSVASIQSLMGHASSETTMVYVHMASPSMINIKSPFDSLGDFNNE